MRNCLVRSLTLAVAALLSILTISYPGISSGPDDAQQNKPQPQKTGQPKLQQHEPQGQDTDTIKIGTDLVVLDVTVLDSSSSRPVMDLRRDQFQVFEDRVPQKIDFFSRDQVPVSLVLTIDTSGSMKPKIDSVIKSCINLVKENRAGDEIAVIEFKDQPELLEEFTEDIEDVVFTLKGLIASRQTAMFDALYLAADYASKEGKNRRKAVVLVTDGLDKNSYYKLNEVVDHLRETDVQIYLIGFTSDLSDQGGFIFVKSEKDKAEKVLKKLAEETGGRAFFPRELNETNSIAQQISTDLRTQYSIGYYPANARRDGTFRSVRVQVDAANGRLVARTRNGYTAPSESKDAARSKD
jgi:Ca-activated chloride channel family protein